MAKEKKEVPQTPEQLAANVRSYFTKDINEQIAEMTPKQSEALMKEMISTPYWIALLKYTSMRTPLLDGQLRTINPTKDPHTISWSQGCMAGLLDIETYIIELNSPRLEAKDEPEEGEPLETRPEGTIIG